VGCLTRVRHRLLNKESKISGNLRNESKRSWKWRSGAKRLRLHITIALSMFPAQQSRAQDVEQSDERWWLEISPPLPPQLLLETRVPGSFFSKLEASKLERC